MVTGLFIPEIAPVVKYSAPTFEQDFFRARAKAPKVVFKNPYALWSTMKHENGIFTVRLKR